MNLQGLYFIQHHLCGTLCQTSSQVCAFKDDLRLSDDKYLFPISFSEALFQIRRASLAWPARTLDQAFFLWLSFLKVRSPVWALWIVLLACNPFSAVLLCEITMSYTLEGTCVIRNASILVVSCSRTTFPVMLGRHWGLDLKQPHSRFCWPTLKGEALLLQLSRMVSSIVLVLTCFFTLSLSLPGSFSQPAFS